MRYQIRLINTETKESQRTNWMFSNRKEAEEYANKWNSLGKPFSAEVIDTKRK